MKARISKTAVTLFVSFGFLVCSAGALLGLGYFIETGATNLTATAQQIAYQQAQAGERFETSRIVEETVSERNELESYVLTEATVIDFISELEDTAARLGLMFSTQTISPEETKDPDFDLVRMDVAFSGPAGTVKRMIRLIETMPYASEVQTVSVGVDAGDVWRAEVVLELDILEYEE